VTDDPQRRLDALQPTQRSPLRTLRIASSLEACSLVLLLFIAVPLKHLGGWHQATSLMGPLHGLTFLFYIYVVIETVSAGDWTRQETARLILVAFIPFGGFANLSWLEGRASRSAAAEVRA
jgi:integral membrane protein